MTVAEFIVELNKLDQSTEVWVDTEFGLFPVDMIYEDSQTAVISYDNGAYNYDKEGFN